MKNKIVAPLEELIPVRKVYLISIPSKDGKSNLLKVCEDLSLVTGKYPYFAVQQVEFIQ